MHKRLILLAKLIVLGSHLVFSQQLDVGIFSGINNSDIHTIQTDNLWKPQKGPMAGISVDYHFFRNFSISSGLRYNVLYFDQMPYKSYQFQQYPSPLGITSYLNNNSSYTFSFLQVPFLLGWHTGTKLDFSIRAGFSLSYLADSEYDPQHYYYYDFVSSYYIPSMSSMLPYYSEKPDFHKYDYGFVYEAGLSYPVKNYIAVNLMASYYIGREEMITAGDSRLGFTAITGGISYSFFTKERNEKTDSTRSKIYISYKLGGIMSENIGKSLNNSYKAKGGFAGGIDLGWQAGEHFALQTGFWLQRKGYQFSDSSRSFVRYAPSNGTMYQVDSKIDLDYAVIPFLLNIGLGKSNRVYLLFGSYLGFKLNGRVTGDASRISKSDYQYVVEEYRISNDVEALYKNSSMGLLMGCGYQLPMFNKYLLNLEFNYATENKNVFLKDNEFQSIETEEDNTVKLSSFDFTVGIKVPLY